jgi:hypothetical protein
MGSAQRSTAWNSAIPFVGANFDIRKQQKWLLKRKY